MKLNNFSIHTKKKPLYTFHPLNKFQSLPKSILIDHFENYNDMECGSFKDEVGPGVLQFSTQQTYVMQECQRHKCQAPKVDFLAHRNIYSHRMGTKID